MRVIGPLDDPVQFPPPERWDLQLDTSSQSYRSSRD
jgi:hypothetical protein